MPSTEVQTIETKSIEGMSSSCQSHHRCATWNVDKTLKKWKQWDKQPFDLNDNHIIKVTQFERTFPEEHSWSGLRKVGYNVRIIQKENNH